MAEKHKKLSKDEEKKLGQETSSKRRRKNRAKVTFKHHQTQQKQQQQNAVHICMKHEQQSRQDEREHTLKNMLLPKSASHSDCNHIEKLAGCCFRAKLKCVCMCVFVRNSNYELQLTINFVEHVLYVRVCVSVNPGRKIVFAMFFRHFYCHR